MGGGCEGNVTEQVGTRYIVSSKSDQSVYPPSNAILNNWNLFTGFITRKTTSNFNTFLIFPRYLQSESLALWGLNAKLRLAVDLSIKVVDRA